eukprot:1993160-Prorocentrum_lima.AAC.1
MSMKQNHQTSVSVTLFFLGQNNTHAIQSCLNGKSGPGTKLGLVLAGGLPPLGLFLSAKCRGSRSTVWI